MSKLYVFNMMSVDGYFEGQNHDLSWHNVDGEFNEFANNQLNKTELIIFGRKTYEMMFSFWPKAVDSEPKTAFYMNNLHKIVVSKTLAEAEWNNSRLISDNIENELITLKKKAKKDIAIFGSAKFISTIMNTQIIDEYRIMINPIILGSGTALFQGSSNIIKLQLIKSREFKNGNVLLILSPKTA